MLWHASSKPQRQPLCGFGGMPYVGRPVETTASKPAHPGQRWRP